MGYRDYSTAKGHIVDASGHGDFTTIAAALTAASSGQVIFIRPGTYTENPTLKAGVDLVAFNDPQTGNVIINGKCTFTSAGTVTLSGLYLQTNSDFLLAVTGSSASIVYLNNCYLNIRNNTGIDYTSSSSSSKIICNFCNGDLGTTGIAIFTNTGAGQLAMNSCSLSNSGNSTTASSTGSGSDFNAYACIFGSPFSCTSGTVGFSYCNINTGNQNATCFTTSGSGSSQIEYSDIISGTASALSIGSGTILNCPGPINVSSTNAAAITGSGTIQYSVINYSNSSKINNVSTQTPYPLQAGLIVNPQTSGIFTFENTITGHDMNVIVDNTDNATPTTQSAVKCLVGGTSGGQPFFSVAQGTAQNFCWGIDNTSGNLHINGATGNNTTTPSTDNNFMSLTPAGSFNYPLTPCVFAKVGTSVTNFTGDGTQANVIYDTVLFDQQNNYNGTTGTFTAPVSGQYYVYATITYTSLTAAHTSYLHLITSSNGNGLNAVGNPGVVRDGNDSYTVQQAGLIHLDASDTLNIQTSVSGSTPTVGIEGENFGQFSNLFIKLAA